MSCNITKGRKRGCKDNLGGIKEIYISQYINYLPSDYNANLGVELFEIPTRFFYKFELDGKQTSFSESLQNNDEGLSYNVNLSTSFVKLDVNTSSELNILQGSLFHVITKLNNGKYYFLGFENGLELTSLDINSGTNLQDFQGYNLTFTGQEQYKGMLFENLEDVGIEVGDTLISILGDENNILSDDDNNLLNTE